LEDRRISAKSIAEQLGISRERVGSIIHEDLDMRKVTKGVLFLHDIAPAHRALATQKKLAYLGFQCLDHPPYSPDLAPSDYHLFPELK
jgi:histone-lysine N-methyltransferase SETMAR